MIDTEDYDDSIDQAYEEEKARLEGPESLMDLINSEIRTIRKEAWRSLRHDYRRGRQIERDDYDLHMAFLPYVDSVEEVLEASVGWYEQYAVAIAVRKGVRDIVNYRYYYHPGSRWDPPDSELWVGWHGLPQTREDDGIESPCSCKYCEVLRG